MLVIGLISPFILSDLDGMVKISKKYLSNLNKRLTLRQI
ncbi:hypothetical protein EV201_2164 [Ancylomarina subtilis]|uniref:Uncharacterized protein n=1 Tax=Ancylomarina subtilis TaxID=1639035 RepID=A0A4Q7VMS2_9BACT|nr:hypothetical protein EV201_2164 [Ancylomarina subtilis]